MTDAHRPWRSTTSSWPRLQELSGLKEKSSLIREALKALIERESARRLARLRGTDDSGAATTPVRGADPRRYVVWIRRFRDRDPTLIELLERGAALTHAFVIGELALGNLRQRELVLRMLLRLHVERHYERGGSSFMTIIRCSGVVSAM